MKLLALLPAVVLLLGGCSDVGSKGGGGDGGPEPSPGMTPQATQRPTPDATPDATPDTSGLPDGGVPDGGDPGMPPMGNRAPSLEAPGARQVQEGHRLAFRVTASDPDGDLVMLSAEALPPGADFVAATGVFSWAPAEGDAGDYAVRFLASDGRLEATATTAVSVTEPPPPDPDDPDAPDRPDCGLGNPCAGACCAAGELCIGGACAEPGIGCTRNDDCAAGEYCEQFLQRCLPDDLPGERCEFRPPIGEFNPRIKWHWTGSETLPSYRQVMMTPAVANLTDDNLDGAVDQLDVPDVIFTTFVSGGSLSQQGVLRALSGEDGSELWTAADANHRVNGLGSIAVGDLDGDGSVEIVAPRWIGDGATLGGLSAFSATGAWLWDSPNDIAVTWGGPSIANVDGEGHAEVIIGNVVLNSDGSVRCRGAGGGFGSNPPNRPLGALADTDLDGRLEIVAGNAIYEAESCALKWANGQRDGFPAVANFDADPEPEIVVVSGGTVRLQQPGDGAVSWSFTVPGGGGVGAPTVADFDGDNAPEIGVAGANFYVVIETNGTLKWQQATIDFSSSVTGSSVFDFEGDGRAEAVYGDECFLFVYDGPTGNILFKRTKSSGTTFENPVIVDVDNDGNAEIVVAANDYAGGIGTRCAGADAAFTGLNRGIIVFGDSLDNWVPTRRIWNQHSYHVTNVNEDGSIPAVEPRHFETINSFRQNVQGEGIFDAPDLVVTEVGPDLSECNEALSLVARIENLGHRGVRAGVPVSFFLLRGNGARELLGVALTQNDLLPGGDTVAVLRWVVPPELMGVLVDIEAVADADANGVGLHNECEELNNSGIVRQTGCALDCPPGVIRPGREMCNGLDDDCDGRVDEDVVAECQTLCGPGMTRCVEDEGRWTACDAPEPAMEICDGIDNDCDGFVDEGPNGESLRNPCGRCGPLGEEICNGVDDDCDGDTDEPGPGLCAEEGQPCQCGRCADPCVRGECGAGQICEAPWCVEPGCE